MKISSILNVVLLFVCIESYEGLKCCSDQRCACVPLGNNIYLANCTGLKLTSSTFPRFYDNVRDIILSNNSIKEILNPISSFIPTSVKKIDLSSNAFYEIREDTFSGLRHLNNLYLRSNKLQRIYLGSLMPLSSLETMDISNNQRLTFRAFRNISHDLQYTKIRKLKMQNIHCDSGVGTMLFVSDVEYLFNTSLQEIDISYNRMQFIEEGAILKFPKSFISADVSYNELTLGKYVLEIANLDNVQRISAGNHVQGSGEGASLQNCHDWRGPNNDAELKKSNESRLMSRLKDISYYIPPNLKYVSIPNYSLGKSIDQISIQKNNSLETVLLCQNELYSWNGPLKNFDKVQRADLSSNACRHISKTFLHGLYALKSLQVQTNFLGNSLSSDTEGEIFSDLKRLIYLDISDNDITTLPAKVFEGLLSMERLNLSRNYLIDWTVSVKHMLNLTKLDLSENRLESLSREAMEEIDYILLKSKRKLSINLAYNALQCTCNTRKFIKWMYENSLIFVGFRSYQCYDEQKKVIPFSDIDVEIRHLEKRCSDYSYLVIIFTIIIVLFIVIIIGGIIYRYRWKLRYIYYITKLKMKTEQQFDDRVSHPYEFDAFISYANEDRVFIEGQLRETLEEKYNLKLQLHARDFLGGKEIAANITDAIHKSHKTVIMLSSHFLKSYWCMFEFNMARMESVYARGGDNVIVIAFIEQIKIRDIPLMMMDVIQTESYIEYPKTEEDEDVFLNKLHDAVTRY